MTSQRSRAVAAFVALVRAHAASTRGLSAELLEEHGLTINDYEALLKLSRAPDCMLRRVDLARELLLTPSGITRLLEGLELAGYVERKNCDSDARVAYAALTPLGHQKLKEATRSHVASIQELFAGRFDDDELASLTTLLERLTTDNSDEGACLDS